MIWDEIAPITVEQIEFLRNWRTNMRLIDSEYASFDDGKNLMVRACDVQPSEKNPEVNLIDNIDIVVNTELKFCLSILAKDSDSEELKHYKEALTTIFYYMSGVEREN
jgi:hypothetical protein